MRFTRFWPCATTLSRYPLAVGLIPIGSRQGQSSTNTSAAWDSCRRHRKALSASSNKKREGLGH
ncbi:30L [Xanthomonas phage Xp10]|uniref:30L n=1 Tax=Xanthomonas phage Xp10 TaxID=2907956 RepID=Q7Y5I7_9CAUD|nr:hypothetical protein Xp10p30 [Xanthomonas phage Xp10]AAP58697.1 30L [Xanthomonas phage Xp10]